MCDAGKRQRGAGSHGQQQTRNHKAGSQNDGPRTTENHLAHLSYLLRCVVQASDREGLVAMVSNTPELMKQAREMMAKGKGEDILTRDWDGGGSTPITARRYLSFTEVRGDDDMFSSDLSDAQLKVSPPYMYDKGACS